MYYTINNCPWLNDDKKYENLDEVIDDIKAVQDLSSSVEEEFCQYIDGLEAPVRLFQNEYSPHLILWNLDRARYRKLKREWLGKLFDEMILSLDIMSNSVEAEFCFSFGWKVTRHKGEIAPVRVFCKDSREDHDSEFLYGIFDTTEEANEAVRELNDFAILNLQYDRYFVADRSHHPTREQIHAHL